MNWRAFVVIVLIFSVQAISAAGQLNISNNPPLPVTFGGTGTTTSFTPGSVVFAGTSGTYSESNTGLFWNDTSKLLCIATNDANCSDKFTVNVRMRVNGTNVLAFGNSAGGFHQISAGTAGAAGNLNFQQYNGASLATTMTLDGVNNKVLVTNSTTSPLYLTTTNCADGTATPADCTAAPAGAVIISAATTSVVVNTTAVTANSEIFVTEDSSLGTRLSVTCNIALGRLYTISARTAATSFTIISSAAPATNPACLVYHIIN